MVTSGVVYLGIAFHIRLKHFEDPFYESPDCERIVLPIPTIENEAGLVVTGHAPNCEDSNQVFVYLHKVNEPESRKNLIFTYAIAYDASEEKIYPTIIWRDDRNLNIAVHHVSLIARNKKLLDGISITYDIGHVDFPNSYHYVHDDDDESDSLPPDETKAEIKDRKLAKFNARIKADQDFNKRYAHSDDFPDIEVFYKIHYPEDN